MNTYYKEQLLSVVTGSSLNSLKLKIHGDNGETNWLNINLDSIEALRVFLNELEVTKKSGIERT